MKKRASQIISASVRVVVNPNNARGPFPHGGTEVGQVVEIELEPSAASPLVVPCEGLGEPSDVLEGENNHTVRMTLRGWDPDAVGAFMSGGYRLGNASQRPGWASPGVTTPGVSAASRAVSILLVPEAPTQVPCLYIPRGVPFVRGGGSIAFSRTEEFRVPLEIVCLRGAAGELYSLEMLGDLTL